MDSFDRLRRRALLGDMLFMIVGASVLFLLGLGHFWYPFVLGVILGMLNLHLHALSVRRLSEYAAVGRETSIGIRAAMLYVARFFILVAVLGYEHLIRGIPLVPAIFGLLGTYAVLVTIGIMDSRRRGKTSAQSEEDGTPEVGE